MIIEFILLCVILVVIAIDFLVKKRKKSSSKEIEKFQESDTNNIKKLAILKWAIISLAVLSLGSIVIYQIVFAPITYKYSEVTFNNNLAYLKNDMSLLTGKINDSTYKGLFVDGKREGNHKFHFFYYSNKDSVIRKLEDRFFQGIFNDLKFYYYKNDNEHGNGVLRKWSEESNYQNGKLEGLTHVWFQNGQLRFKGNYRNGMLEGLTTVWYENGQLRFKGNYRNGKLEGLTQMWYQNRQLKLDYKYFNKKPANGLNRKWRKNGQLLSFHNYYKGTGSRQYYYENGQTAEKHSHTDGKLESIKKWYKNGQLESEQIYKNGIKAFLRVWWENGIQCKEVSYKGFGDSYSEWDENGELLYKGSFRNWENIY